MTGPAEMNRAVCRTRVALVVWYPDDQTIEEGQVGKSRRAVDDAQITKMALHPHKLIVQNPSDLSKFS